MSVFAANVIIIVCIGALWPLMHVHVVCVCVCVYIYYVCVCVCTYTMCVCVCVHILCVCVCVYIYYVCVCVCTYTMHDLMRYKLKSVFFSRFCSLLRLTRLALKP